MVFSQFLLEAANRTLRRGHTLYRNGPHLIESGVHAAGAPVTATREAYLEKIKKLMAPGNFVYWLDHYILVAIDADYEKDTYVDSADSLVRSWRRLNRDALILGEVPFNGPFEIRRYSPQEEDAGADREDQ